MNMAKPMPTFFFGHGNPMTTLSDNDYTRGWAAVGAEIPQPKAVLCVSAHWYLPATLVTAMPSPRTIHDFGGFPRELFDINYPAPGYPALADRVQNLLAPISVSSDGRWGLDHGTWTVLRHVFPEANVPVVQLSIDETKPTTFHYEIGKQLAPLRDEGILIIGSGNIVHNLRAYSWDQPDVEPLDWAVRFDRYVRELLLAGEDGPLIDYQKLGKDGLLSAPTPDHFLPLLYITALRRGTEPISFPVEGFDGGSMSMLTVQIG
jgi:4,5-DOPA dioxygenase extradiol